MKTECSLKLLLHSARSVCSNCTIFSGEPHISGSILVGDIIVVFEIVLFLLNGFTSAVGPIFKSIIDDVKFNYLRASETNENCCDIFNCSHEFKERLEDFWGLNSGKD